MPRFAIPAWFLLALAFAGCGGGGIPEGMPAGASGGLTPEQQKEHDKLIAEEEAAAKAQGKNRQ